MTALATIISILSQALTVVPAGTALYEKFMKQRTQAQSWAANNYTPTDQDWAALDQTVADDMTTVNTLTRQS
jgi:hypothetical protein